MFICTLISISFYLTYKILLGPMLNSTPIQFIEHWKAELVPTQSLHPYFLASLVQVGTLPTTKGKSQTPAQPQILWSRLVSCLQDMLGQWWHQDCESNQLSELAKGPLHKMEPVPNTVWVNTNLRLDIPGSYGKIKYSWSKNRNRT